MLNNKNRISKIKNKNILSQIHYEVELFFGVSLIAERTEMLEYLDSVKCTTQVG